MSQCSICAVDFKLNEEGGVEGEFGIIPVAFCPTCLSSCVDMVHWMEEFDEECE